MEIEIERKWLASEDIKKHIIRDGFKKIQQGYLSPTTRVRIDNDIAILCIKIRQSLLTVKEYNYEIPMEDAVELLSNLPVIQKTRFNLGNDYTLDVFEGKLEGLLLVEKEFESEELAAEEELPEWLGNEVTGDPTYINANLGDALFVEGVGITSELNIVTGDEEETEMDEFVIP